MGGLQWWGWFHWLELLPQWERVPEQEELLEQALLEFHRWILWGTPVTGCRQIYCERWKARCECSPKAYQADDVDLCWTHDT